MSTNVIKNLFPLLLALIIICFPIKTTSALTHTWISVPKSQYGEQLWDKKNIEINEDGSIRVFSKFIPKNQSNIAKDILYTMDIKCSDSSFRDVAVGAKEFNEYKNNDPEWKDPNNDKLILGVIKQVCRFVNLDS